MAKPSPQPLSRGSGSLPLPRAGSLFHTTSGATESVRCWMIPATAPCRLLPSARTIRQSAQTRAAMPAARLARPRRVEQRRVDVEQRRVDEHHRRVEQVDDRRDADARDSTRSRLSSAASQPSRIAPVRSPRPRDTARPSFSTRPDASAESLATVSRQPVLPHPHCPAALGHRRDVADLAGQSRVPLRATARRA